MCFSEVLLLSYEVEEGFRGLCWGLILCSVFWGCLGWEGMNGLGGQLGCQRIQPELFFFFLLALWLAEA